MQNSIRIFAGVCTVVFEGEADTRQEGTVLTIVKPDNTVLVHDASGYQPAAWLTRPETVEITRHDGGFEIVATAGDQRLSVRSVEHHCDTKYPISPAGATVGTCPDCEQALVRAGGAVVCIGCLTNWSLPHDATVAETCCPDCRLPMMVLRRGAEVRVCLDQTCASLESTLSERFDCRWSCPTCGGVMVVERDGPIQIECVDCARGHTIPAGLVSERCSCGLPRFETDRGDRCLDTDCDRGPGATVADAAP